MSITYFLEKEVGSVAQWQSIRLQIERSVVQIRPLLIIPKYDKKINIAWSREKSGFFIIINKLYLHDLITGIAKRNRKYIKVN